MKGLFEEGDDSGKGSDMEELKVRVAATVHLSGGRTFARRSFETLLRECCTGQDYVMASMMSDTSLDPDELITEFLAGCECSGRLWACVPNTRS